MKHCSTFPLLLGQLEHLTYYDLLFSDWNVTPMPLFPENDLLTADIIQWFRASPLGHHLGPPRSLVRVLGQIVNQTEVMLCQ